MYSLGAILYVLLTNRSPFAGNSAAEIVKLVEGGVVVSPPQAESRDPRALQAICLKAMALRPEDRFQSAQALADDLERWLADAPVNAFREGLAVRSRRLIEQHSLALLLILAAAAGGITAATIGWNTARACRVELDSLAYATAEAAVPSRS